MKGCCGVFDGSILAIERIPQDVKGLCVTAFKIDKRFLVESAARHKKWLDQSQSLNLYVAEPNGRKLDDLYKLDWRKGVRSNRKRPITCAPPIIPIRKSLLSITLLLMQSASCLKNP